MRPFHILVVDDQRDLADLLAMLIQLWGHEAIVAYDGPRALEIALAKPPDVVFLDIDLPGMDGYEVAFRLRREPRMDKVLIIALSGLGREADRERFKEVGIDYHFVKPVDPKRLRQLLTLAQKLR